MTENIAYFQKKRDSMSMRKSQNNKKLTVSEIHRATTICICDRLRRKVPNAQKIDF